MRVDLNLTKGPTSGTYDLEVTEGSALVSGANRAGLAEVQLKLVDLLRGYEHAALDFEVHTCLPEGFTLPDHRDYGRYPSKDARETVRHLVQAGLVANDFDSAQQAARAIDRHCQLPLRDHQIGMARKAKHFLDLGNIRH